MNKLILLLLALCSLNSCVNEDGVELQTQDYLNVKSRDILVLSQGTRSVIQLDRDGQYKDTLFVAPASSTLRTITWDQAGQRVLVGYTYSTTTKVVSIAPLSKEVKDFSINTFITTALTAMIPNNGNFVFSTTPANLRKLNSNGAHVTGSGFPLVSGLSGTIVQLSQLTNDLFMICSTTSPYLKIFNSSGQEQFAASGINPPVGTTALTGCHSLTNGQIVLSWSGTTDTVAIYNRNDFATPLYTYSDTSILGSPKQIQITANGNILVSDTVFNWLVELTPQMEFVRTIGEGYFSTPVQFISL